MSVLRNIIVFIILLSIIVSIHEFGHLIAAKIFGVYCKEYSIGMGPKLYSKIGKETEYSVKSACYRYIYGKDEPDWKKNQISLFDQ